MKWRVKTQVTTERVYAVEAENEKMAIEASTLAEPVLETDIDEETLSVVAAVES